MTAESSSHLVIARKWRPERFSELVGQEQVTRTLVQALKTGRIAHAFLFAGIRGVGKTTAARILARCLNCERGPTAEPCGQCPACVEIRQGRALDVSEIDGATYRKIDDARAIIENLSYGPARDRFKIYIIDEAHQLTDQAFNALLKTLEEPPPHVKFILATTEPQKMPETILSRLQRYDFGRIPFAVMVARLRELCEREGVGAEDGALRLIAREAGGSMRDAERTLEGAIASVGGTLVEAEIAAALGMASRGAVLEIVAAILARDTAAAFSKVRELIERGANLEALGRDLLQVLRNLNVAKLASADTAVPFSDLSDHEAAEIHRLASQASARDLMRLFRLMAAGQEEILRSPYADLMLEMAVVRMAALAPVMDAEELLRAVSAGGGSSGAGPAPSAPGAQSSGTGGSPAAAGARRMRVAGEVKADAPLRTPNGPRNGEDLPDFRRHLRNRRAALAGFMEQGAALQFAGDVLSVVPSSDVYVRYLGDNRDALAELAREFFGRPVRVEIVSKAQALAQGAEATETGTEANERPSVAQAGGNESAEAQESDCPAESSRNADRGQPASAGASNNGEARRQLLADPVIRSLFDILEARLVEIRPPRAAQRPEDLADRAEDSEEAGD